MTTEALAPIDPLAPTVDGAYSDDLVTVTRGDLGLDTAAQARTIRTAHFEITTVGGRLLVRHRIVATELDDDLAGIVSGELFNQGWVRGSDLFERIFTGVVLSSAPTPEQAWESFYRNTLRRVQQQIEGGDGPSAGSAHGSIEGYAPIYEHAAGLMVGTSALEVASCFGFFSLRLAQQGYAVTASDVSPGTVRLLDLMARRLGVPLETLTTDAARVPLPDRCVDTVFVLHLLEHLTAEHGARVVTEAARLARQRVVVAVPYEAEPDESFGHVRTLSATDLTGLGARVATRSRQHDHHGGWLVLDVGVST